MVAPHTLPIVSYYGVVVAGRRSELTEPARGGTVPELSVVYLVHSTFLLKTMIY